MKPTITNKCKSNYRVDVENIVKNIVHRIPEKFMEGLSDVSLLDFGKEAYPMCRYIKGVETSQGGRIEIYLDNPDFTRMPFFSTLSVNIHFLLAINQHIDKYLKNISEDEEILAINTSRINHNWMYFGKWIPLHYLSGVFSFFVGRRRPFQTLLKWWSNKFIKKT